MAIAGVPPVSYPSRHNFAPPPWVDNKPNANFAFQETFARTGAEISTVHFFPEIPFLLFGRDMGAAHVFVGHPSISGQHAVVAFGSGDGKCYIQDLESGSGTFVNDTLVPYVVRTELLPGARIRFGKSAHIFIFHDLRKPIPPPLPPPPPPTVSPGRHEPRQPLPPPPRPLEMRRDIPPPAFNGRHGPPLGRGGPPRLDGPPGPPFGRGRGHSPDHRDDRRGGPPRLPPHDMPPRDMRDGRFDGPPADMRNGPPPQRDFRGPPPPGDFDRGPRGPPPRRYDEDHYDGRRGPPPGHYGPPPGRGGMSPRGRPLPPPDGDFSPHGRGRGRGRGHPRENDMSPRGRGRGPPPDGRYSPGGRGRGRGRGRGHDRYDEQDGRW